MSREPMLPLPIKSGVDTATRRNSDLMNGQRNTRVWESSCCNWASHRIDRGLFSNFHIKWLLMYSVSRFFILMPIAKAALLPISLFAVLFPRLTNVQFRKRSRSKSETICTCGTNEVVTYIVRLEYQYKEF
jgi:hypothetical protein